jgi:ParB-like nuclease domain
MRQAVNELPISAVIIGERHRRAMEDIPALASSIKSVGLLQPVVIDSHGTLTAGQRRLKPQQFYDVVLRASYAPYGEAFQREPLSSLASFWRRASMPEDPDFSPSPIADMACRGKDLLALAAALDIRLEAGQAVEIARAESAK